MGWCIYKLLDIAFKVLNIVEAINNVVAKSKDVFNSENIYILTQTHNHSDLGCL